jgi:ribonuclease R
VKPIVVYSHFYLDLKDYCEFDEKNYCLRGRRKNKIYSLGDAITIRVARANLEKKQLDFALIEK